MKITREENCRVCGARIESVLDLGEIYLSGFVQNQSQANKAPLALAKCAGCGLVQLQDTVELDAMYRQYWYTSSLNRSMVESLRDVVNDIESRIALNANDIVVDIGANDCTMLGLYSRKDLWTVAFEPALNLLPSGQNRPLVWIPDYFSAASFKTYLKHPNHPEWADKKARVVTAIAMFYDLPDPHKFVQDVATILADDGIFVIQFTDLLSMINLTAFDNICHEHLEYYRLSDVYNILKAHGLEVIDVGYNSVNGGSLRVTASHAGRYPINRIVSSALEKEAEFLAENTIESFSSKIEKAKTDTREFLQQAAEYGKKVCLLGASTKGNTLLQYCQITEKDIPYAAEVNPDKFGLRTVGSNIYIMREQEVLAMRPAFLFVPIWHFEKSLVSNPKIREYIRTGGQLVFPLPEFHVINSTNLGEDND